MKKLKDKKLTFIFTSSSNASSQLHHEVVAFLVNVLDALGIECNYDHIITTVQKHEDIPLEYKDHFGTHRADISFCVGDGVIALIEVKTRSLNAQFYHRLAEKKQRERKNGDR